jgi:hypothetical protein
MGGGHLATKVAPDICEVTSIAQFLQKGVDCFTPVPLKSDPMSGVAPIDIPFKSLDLPDETAVADGKRCGSFCEIS